jgi:hypothetical protein
VLVLIIFWICCGIAGAMIYNNKGLDAWARCALGGLLGPIGIVIALVAKPNDKALEHQAIEGGDMRKCPACAELIKSEARKCRYCGTELTPLVTRP